MLVTVLVALAAVVLVSTILWSANFLSYRYLKERTLRERRWDYNIRCGETDGGGINADIVRHGAIPRFDLVTDVSALPHADGAFTQVLCSHTLEHVAALNPFEHRVIFLTLRTRHDDRMLPLMLPLVRYLPARRLQALRGQRIIAHAPGDRLLRALGLR